MDDRSRREEEERRESEERRRREESRTGTGGRRGEDLFDEELFGRLESGLGRGSQSRRGPPEDPDLVQDREPDLDPCDPGRGRQRSPGQSKGLYGSQIGSNMLRSAVAEIVGTFVLVFTGTAVTVAAILQRSTVGSLGFYDSLAVALAFGLALAALVAAIVWGMAEKAPRVLQAAAVDAYGRPGMYVVRAQVMQRASITDPKEFRAIAEYLEECGWIAEADPDYGVFVLTPEGIDAATD